MRVVVLGYLWGIIAGVPVTWAISAGLHWGLGKTVRDPGTSDTRRIMWIPALLGVVERAIVITLLIWALPTAGAFMGTWIAVKAAGGWGTLKDGTLFSRCIFLVGLMGSALSILWAVCAAIWVRSVWGLP